MSLKNKKIDGIKKLSREEIIKARKLVLDEIKQSNPDAESGALPAKHPIMLDGLWRHQAHPARLKQESPVKKEKESKALAPDFVHDKIAREQLKKNTSEKEKKERIEANKQVEEEKKEAARLSLAREQALAARKQQLKILKKEKAKKIRQNIVKKIGLFSKELKANIKAAFLRSLYWLMVALVLSILFYLIFLILILKFDLDNNLTRSISNYFPAPAIITKEGVVNYYEYKDFKNQILKTTETGYDSIKLLLAKKIVMDNLINKYRSSIPPSSSQSEIEGILSEKIAADKEVNTVGLERIKKIKNLIDKNGDFVQTANKFGDEQGLLNISLDNQDDYPFSEQVKKLNISEVSDIIITPQGYYIFKCYEKSATVSGLSYVFIKAKSLDEYLDEAAINLKMWSLAN